MRKRLLSALLAMAMVLTMLPMSAFAAEQHKPTVMRIDATIEGADDTGYTITAPGKTLDFTNETGSGSGYWVGVQFPKTDNADVAKVVYVLNRKGEAITDDTAKGIAAKVSSDVVKENGLEAVPASIFEEDNGVFWPNLAEAPKTEIVKVITDTNPVLVKYHIDFSGVKLTPVKGTVGKANLVDKDGTVTGEDLVKGYTAAEGTIDAETGVVPVNIATTDLAEHKNANGAGETGRWVGFSVLAPEDAVKVNYVFANSKDGLDAAQAGNGVSKGTLEKADFEKNVDGIADHNGMAFYMNASNKAVTGASAEKTWVSVEWIGKSNRDVEFSMGKTIYHMDLANVHWTGETQEIPEVAIALKIDGLKVDSALPQATTSTTGAAVTTKWYKADGTTEVDAFDAAGKYVAKITVAAADANHVLKDSYTVTVNGEAATADHDVITVDNVDVAAADPQTQKVTSVKITMDQEVNVNGTLPEVKVVTVPANAVDVSISGWKKGTDTVEAGNVTKTAGTYTATFAVTANSNFELAADTAYEVNGVAAADKDHLTANLTVKEIPSGSVIAAPLVDQANNVTSDKLVDADSYKVEKGTAANTIVVKATGLKQHKASAEAGMGYWVGVGIPKVAGDEYAVGRGVAPAVANMEFGAKNDSEYNGYVTFYFNAGITNGGDGANKDLPQNGYIAVKNGDNAPVVYTIDLSGVKIAQPKIQAVGFEAAGDDANKAINDLTKEMRGKDGTVSDAERDTMFVALNGLDSTAGYKVVVKNGATTLLTKTLAAGHKTETVFYFTLNKWTGSTGEDSLEGKLAAGDYTIELQKADGTKIVGETITLKEVTMNANGGTFGAKVGTDGKDPYAEKITNGVLKMMVNSTATNTDLDAKVPTVTKEHNTFVKWNWTENTATAQWTPAEIKTVTVKAYSDDAGEVEVGSLTAKVEDGAIKISGLLPEAAKKIVLSYIMSDDETGTPKTINVTIADGKLTIGDADKKLTIDSGKEYGVDVSGIAVTKVDVPVANPTPVVNDKALEGTELSPAQKTEATTAAASVAAPAVKDVVLNQSEALSTAVAAESTEKNMTENAAELVKLGVADATKDNVKVVVQPVMDVEIAAYHPTEKKLTLDITAGYRLVAVKNDVAPEAIEVHGDTGVTTPNAVELSKENLEVSEPITISVDLPAGFATSGTIAVLHEKNGNHYHSATVAGDVATFTSSDGLSPFTFDAAANLVAEVNGKSYTSLADAIKAAGNNDVVTLLDGIKTTGANEAKDIKFDADKNITFKLGGTLDAAVEIKVNDATINVTTDAAGVAHKFEKNTGNGGGMGPIGGGGSGATTYSVNVPTTEHGTVTVNPRNASKDATVTITVSPNQGYILDTLTVTDKDGNNIELTKVDSNKYTFKMPASRVEIKASFKEGTAPADGGFTDITSGEYYYDAVLWAVDKGITTGLTETTFGPNASCTRAQMVTFLWRAAGSPEPTATTTAFTDVDSNEYYYKAMLWAVEKGITKGTTDTTFAPNATVTRAQTVTFLYRYANSPAVSGTNAFTDLEAGEYYVDAVQWAATNGITTGTSETTFSPANNCTRGQIVTFLYRHLVK